MSSFICLNVILIIFLMKTGLAELSNQDIGLTCVLDSKNEICVSPNYFTRYIHLYAHGFQFSKCC